MSEKTLIGFCPNEFWHLKFSLGKGESSQVLKQYLHLQLKHFDKGDAKASKLKNVRVSQQISESGQFLIFN